MVGVFFIHKIKKRGGKMSYLKVAGVDLSPYIKSMTTDDESIWNSKAGRAIDENATFTGRIVARKWKISMTTRVLSQAESALIAKTLKSGTFVNVEFIPTDSGTDELITKTFYVSSISNSVYSYAAGLPRYSGMSFNLIEQ